MAAPAAAASAAPPVAQNVETFIKWLQCPVDFPNFLVTAETLVPCMHKVNEAALKKMQEFRDLAGKCPVCRTPFTGHYPDHTVRQLAILLQAQNHILPQASAAIQAEELPKFPFPGKGAKFKLVSDPGWKLYEADGMVCRELKFISQTPDSLFGEMHVLGDKNGSVRISLALKDITLSKEDREKIGRYFAGGGLFFSEIDIVLGHYVTSNPDDLKTMLRLIATHNEIPEAQLVLIRALSEAGSWTHVTPLKPGERVPAYRIPIPGIEPLQRELRQERQLQREQEWFMGVEPLIDHPGERVPAYRIPR